MQRANIGVIHGQTAFGGVAGRSRLKPGLSPKRGEARTRRNAISADEALPEVPPLGCS
jgi:hypothetical protein